jgi:peptide/nickel transport system permease protein
VIVAATLGVAYAILTESALSYLGLGVRPPTPSWGNMLSSARSYLWTAPHLAIFPGLFILLTVLAYNSLGDVLRDALSS